MEIVNYCLKIIYFELVNKTNKVVERVYSLFYTCINLNKFIINKVF